MKKILVIYLDELEIGWLSADEHMGNFHRLMEFGFYGRLEAKNPIGFWEPFLLQGARVVVAGHLTKGFSDEKGINFHHFNENRSSDDFRWLLQSLAAGGWDYFQYHQPSQQHFKQSFTGVDNSRENTVLYNEIIGEILDALSDEVIVLILCSQRMASGAESVSAQVVDPLGFFILASSNCPINGELRGVLLEDLVATLLELGGYEMPASLTGKSLVLGMISNTQSEGLSDEEEAILRERLSGLGYIG